MRRRRRTEEVGRRKKEEEEKRNSKMLPFPHELLNIFSIKSVWGNTTAADSCLAQ